MGLDFDENQVNLNQMDTINLPDNVIADLMEEINETEPKNDVSGMDIESVKRTKKKNWFAELSNDQIDEIVANNHAPKTKKQTN